jgi:hypothetical protein
LPPIAHRLTHPVVTLFSLAAVLRRIEMLTAEAVDEGLRIFALGEAKEAVLLAPSARPAHH